MNELSLFTGAGGGVLGTHHLLGWKTCGYVEWNEYCQRVIAARIADGYLASAPIFTDVRKFVQSGAAEQYRGVTDVVSAGFPCQPFSVAGKQQAANDERNMWPATRDVIRIVRPTYAWLENVTGLLATGYCERIFADLAALGFDAEWGVFSVAGSGGPHLRERIFIAAHDRSQRVQGNIISSLRRIGIFPWGEDGGGTPSWPERSGISEPTIRRLGDGVPNGVDRLRAAGNAQVPAVVARMAWVSRMSTAADKRWFSAVASLETCSLCGKWGVQVAHSNIDRGMGQKSASHMTAALCPECHHEIDNGRLLDRSERRAQMDRAIVLTHSRLIDAGQLVLKVK